MTALPPVPEVTVMVPLPFAGENVPFTKTLMVSVFAFSIARLS